MAMNNHKRDGSPRKFSGRAICDLMKGVAVMPGTKPQRIERNTIQYTRPDGVTVYRLHDTDIVTRDGATVTINTGGWRTVTTRDRVEVILRSIFGGYERVGLPYGSCAEGGGWGERVRHRAWEIGGVVFKTQLAIVHGRAVANAQTRAEAESARLEYIESKKEQRARASDRARERRRAAAMMKHGRALYQAWERERPLARAARKESRS